MGPDEPAAAADYINRIAGARSWRVANTLWARMGGLLWADAMLEPWPTGEEYAASCPAMRCHDVPGFGCKCGIHAWYDVESLVREWYRPEDFRHVSGIVSARGGVVLHDLGWRAQYARVEAILADDVPDEDLPIPKRTIAEAYGVPLVAPEDYAGFCASKDLVLLKPGDP